METLDVLFTMDCEAPAGHSSEGGPPDWETGARAAAGFCAELLKHSLHATLFAVPSVAERMGGTLRDLERAGVEVGLHYHPQDHGYPDYLGGFDADRQRAMLREACDQWAQGMGRNPESFRGGNYSCNDHTFPVLEGLGFRQGSLSAPDRNFTRVRANWKGALLQPHHANRANRLIEGDLEFLEVPVTVDPESVLWGGLTPLELRLEMVDARAHGYTLRKSVERQMREGITWLTLVPMTHNTFDYSDPAEFRLQVLKGVLDEIGRCAETNRLSVAGDTLQEFHRKFDRAVPAGSRPGGTGR